MQENAEEVLLVKYYIYFIYFLSYSFVSGVGDNIEKMVESNI